MPRSLPVEAAKVEQRAGWCGGGVQQLTEVGDMQVRFLPTSAEYAKAFDRTIFQMNTAVNFRRSVLTQGVRIIRMQAEQPEMGSYQ